MATSHIHRIKNWSGRRESNPRTQLGRLLHYHYATPARTTLHPELKPFLTLVYKTKVQGNGGGDRIRTCVRYAVRFTV